ncbi:MAG TPA: CHAD domain-containing protein [Blastocatellia bacterium]|nr:CHAD domain-containing protein [Blastocatellia bacterium]
MQTVMTLETTGGNSADQPASAAPQADGKTRRTLSAILHTHFIALRQYHHNLMESQDPDAIHKMRVTTRRAQAALDLLHGQLDIASVKRRLRRWRRELSRVRNYDVFLMLLEKEAKAKRAGNRQPFELVRAVLQQRRADTANKVREYLLDKSIIRLAARIGLNLPEPPLSPSNGQAKAFSTTDTDESLPGAAFTLSIDEVQLAAHTADRLDQRVAEFLAKAAQSHPATEAAELHELRIAAKRVRYLFEIISDMGYGDATRALVWLRNLQDRIGDWHDLESLEQEIIEIVSERDFLKAHLLESSRMLQVAAHLQKKKERLVAKLFPVEVPRNIMATSQRLSKALRRSIPRKKASLIESLNETLNKTETPLAASSPEP